MSDLRWTNLILFFTRGVSLRTWDEVGMLEREVAIYKRLQDRGVKVCFVTYGDARDLQYADRLDSIRIVSNRWRLPERWYIHLVSELYPLLWREPTVFKSNQIQGADIALQAARRCGKNFIARCGYLYSDFMERQHGLDSGEAKRARALEQEVFVAADRVVVTTSPIQRAVMQRYQVPAERIVVIPNYVDTNLFRPDRDAHDVSRRISFIGRLDEQKNPLALLEAIKDLDVELLIVGSGPLAGQLREAADSHGLRVRFLGNVPHRQLPGILKSATLFVLPSHYEGHPKTLLEAMACGVPVIGTDVPGIREIIRHRDTGYSCGTSAEEIRTAIQGVLGDAELRTRMALNAREFVVQHFALEQVVKMELALLEELVE